MMHSDAPDNRDRRGAAMVELAAVSPVFFLMLLGIFEFGGALMVSQVVTNAAREGAREAVLEGSTNQKVESFIKDFLHSSIDVSPGKVDVTITVDSYQAGNQVSQAERGDLCRVRVEVPFEEAAYVTGDYLAGQKFIAESAMRHE